MALEQPRKLVSLVEILKSPLAFSLTMQKYLQSWLSEQSLFFLGRQIWKRLVTYGWVMSHMNESCPIWMSHVPYEWGLSHIYHMRQASFIWEMTHSYGTWLIHMWQASFICDKPHSYGKNKCVAQDNLILRNSCLFAKFAPVWRPAEIAQIPTCMYIYLGICHTFAYIWRKYRALLM